jgi:hypothetical protein
VYFVEPEMKQMKTPDNYVHYRSTEHFWNNRPDEHIVA